MQKISYKNEIYRKLIHLSSLWMPLAIWLLSPETAQLLFGALLVFMMVYEVVRRVPGPVNTLLAPILRPHEQAKFRLTGASYVVAAAFLCCLLFAKTVTVPALCIMLMCDTAASLIGRKWGRTPLCGKSAEGVAAFMVSGVLVIAVLRGIDASFPTFVTGLVAVLVAGVVELFSSRLKLDDNFSVTLSAAIVLWALQ